MLCPPTPFQSVRKEYSITQGNEPSHTLKIMTVVLTKLSLLKNAVLLHRNNAKLVLFSLKYLGRSSLQTEQANSSSSGTRNVSSISQFALTHPYSSNFFPNVSLPPPPPADKMTDHQNNKLHFLSPVLCSPANSSHHTAKSSLFLDPKWHRWLLLPELQH